MFQAFYELLGHGEFLKYNRRLMDIIAKDVCERLGDDLCENLLFALVGTDRLHFNIVSDVKCHVMLE